jgi:hypothetical protein
MITEIYMVVPKVPILPLSRGNSANPGWMLPVYTTDMLVVIISIYIKFYKMGR